MIQQGILQIGGSKIWFSQGISYGDSTSLGFNLHGFANIGWYTTFTSW